MKLHYNYAKILSVYKQVKKSYEVNQLVEMVQFVFTSEDVLHLFIKEGLDLKTTDEAIQAISDAMEQGEDYFDIQQDVVQGLIDANFCVKVLTQILEDLKLTMGEEVQE